MSHQNQPSSEVVREPDWKTTDLALTSGSDLRMDLFLV